MNTWAVIVAVGACTYLFRVSMLMVANHGDIPPAVERAARFAMPTTFAALAATSMANHLGTDLGPLAPSAALVVAVIAVRLTGSSRAALLVGMPTLWVLSALGG